MSGILTEKIIPQLSLFMYEGHLLGLDRCSGGVFEIDEKEAQVELKGFVPKARYREWSFSRVYVWSKKLIFIPYNYTDIYIYDVQNKTWDSIVVFSEYDLGACLDAVVLKERIILFPFNGNQIIVVNMRNNQVENRIMLTDVYAYKGGAKLFISHLEIGGFFILPIFSTNEIIRMSLADYSIEKIVLANTDFEANGITTDGEYIYILSRNDFKILKLTMKLDVVQEISIGEELIPIENQYTYFEQLSFSYYGGKVFCFPARGNHAISVDVDSGKTKRLRKLDDIVDVGKNSEFVIKFNSGIAIENKIYIASSIKELIVVFDMQTEEFFTISTRNNDPNRINFNSFIKSIIEE